jgi:hypothetical protein
MRGEHASLHIFAFEQAGGVPVEPTFRVMRPTRADKFVLKMMTEERKPVVFVWDWQHDGIRMRVAKMKNQRVRWSMPQNYWLLHGDRDDG